MYRLLALGDSYTVGEGIPSEDSWPQLLMQRLLSRDVLIAPPQIIATTGWTSADLQAALDQAELTPPYDIVTLGIGVNNQYEGLAAADYAREFERLLQQAIALAGERPRHVFVLSIPDWSVTPFAFASGRNREQIAAEIQAFNRENARLSYAYGVQYIHVTEISRDARRGPQFLAADGLHYAKPLYTRWVDEIFPKLWHTLLPGMAIHIPLLYQAVGSEEAPDA